MAWHAPADCVYWSAGPVDRRWRGRRYKTAVASSSSKSSVSKTTRMLVIRLVVLPIDSTRRRRRRRRLGIDFRGGRKCERRRSATGARPNCPLSAGSSLLFRLNRGTIQLTIIVWELTLYLIHCEFSESYLGPA